MTGTFETGVGARGRVRFSGVERASVGSTSSVARGDWLTKRPSTTSGSGVGRHAVVPRDIPA